MSGGQSAVDALLYRLNLGQYVAQFRSRGLTNPKMLKNLAQDELEEIFPDPLHRNMFLGGYGEGTQGDARQDMRGKGAGAGAAGKGGRQYGGYGGGGGGGGQYGGYGDYGDQRGGRFERDEEIPAPANLPGGDSDVVQLEVSVPHYTVPFLLGQRAAKLNQINQKYGTTNSRINRPEGEEQGDEVSFCLYGKAGQVEQAKAAIETLAGVTKLNRTNQQFQEMLLGRTKMVTALLYALNERRNAKSSPLGLEPDTIPEHVSQFLFCNPYSHIQQFSIKVPEMARKKFDIIGKILFNLPTVQAIIFCSNSDHMEKLLKKKVQAEQLSGIPPEKCFLNPQMKKEERVAVTAEFEKGYGPLDKWDVAKPEKKEDDTEAPKVDYVIKEKLPGGFKTDKNRLLITTDDYARLARKNSVPYVGLVINYDLPKTKEGYLRRIACTGRNIKGKATRGVAITLMTPQDEGRIEELKRFGLKIQELPANFMEAIDVDMSDEVLPPQPC
eukprot:TRINITY_DN1199_c5_g1_i1.p1 TRINITY_DN1199_c5_g1~~TRINITY_DN1199_c5_g1_i1.p1  ORF type:complete len:497 (+),score=235.92 TRINITY_DN1199_c5_g1_i1:133-1623(+)